LVMPGTNACSGFARARMLFREIVLTPVVQFQSIAGRQLFRLPFSVFRLAIQQSPTCIESGAADRKSTRLNSSHQIISYAVFCLQPSPRPLYYTLSLHDALPISGNARYKRVLRVRACPDAFSRNRTYPSRTIPEYRRPSVVSPSL